MPPHGHEPVLLHEALDLLDPQPGQVAVDCTLGRGGHALAIAERLGPDGLLIGIDQDPDNLAYAEQRLANAGCQLHLVHANFGELARVLGEANVGGVDLLLADLGVSTNQLLDGEHGLSFADAEAPLDMRLDPRLRLTAADIVNRWDAKRIADTLFQHAQERLSRRIARKIIETRGRAPIRTVGELADLVRRCVPRPKGRRGHAIDPATRTFMALRMAVNGEPDALGKLLDALPIALNPGGRAAIISFHSGEDRLVKHRLRELDSFGTLALLTKRPVVPGDAEERDNPRSRSAKLRAARRPATASAGGGDP